jgi:outer membrane immunogenic protein
MAYPAITGYQSPRGWGNFMTIKSGLAAAALIATVAAASAADMGRPVYKAPPMAVAAYNWSGLYAGVHIGYGSTKANFSGLGGTSSPTGDGLLLGGQIGYNWQAAGSPWVYGIEADVSGVGADADTPPNVNSAIFGPNAIGTVRGRVGYAADRALWYLTGGYAWADNELKLSGPAFGGTLTSSKVHSGWTIGGGLEWAFADAWSAKIEYLYMNFAKENYFPGTLGTSGLGIDFDMHTVKLGVNYIFGAGKAPVVAKY